MGEPLVEVERGALVEALHRGDIAVVDAGGTLLAQVGDPAMVTYWRSAAKPFQAMPIADGAAMDRWSLAPEDIALIAGSHNGEPAHTERVADLLARLGCGAEDLRCGVHPPLDAASAAAVVCSGAGPSVLHNNCSANHAGMLGLALQLGVDPVGYLFPEHPVQQEILATVARFTGTAPAQIELGVDGCGAPCYGISVYSMALAYARLVSPAGLPEPDSSAASVVRDAMLSHPYLVGGRGRFDTDLIATGGGVLVAKGGAGGVQCVGVANGIGVAIKVEDGVSGPSVGRPGSVSAVAVLRQLGVLDDAQVESLGEHARPTVRSLSGREVGHVRPVFALRVAETGSSWRST